VVKLEEEFRKLELLLTELMSNDWLEWNTTEFYRLHQGTSETAGWIIREAAKPRPSSRQRLSDVTTRVSVFAAVGGVEERKSATSFLLAVRQCLYIKIRDVQFGTRLLWAKKATKVEC
jgi:hypothetical protein